MVYFVRFDTMTGPKLQWLVFRENQNGFVEFVAAFPDERIARRYASERNC